MFFFKVNFCGDEMILQGFDNANLSFINSVRKRIFGENSSLSLSFSQFVIFFVCKAKIHKFRSKIQPKIHKIHGKFKQIHKFSVIANEPQGEVWQSIVKSGFYRLPRKNSLTLIFARNDGVAKIHNFHKFFSNFHSKRFQNFENLIL